MSSRSRITRVAANNVEDSSSTISFGNDFMLPAIHSMSMKQLIESVHVSKNRQNLRLPVSIWQQIWFMAGLDSAWKIQLVCRDWCYELHTCSWIWTQWAHQHITMYRWPIFCPEDVEPPVDEGYASSCLPLRTPALSAPPLAASSLASSLPPLPSPLLTVTQPHSPQLPNDSSPTPSTRCLLTSSSGNTNTTTNATSSHTPSRAAPPPPLSRSPPALPSGTSRPIKPLRARFAAATPSSPSLVPLPSHSSSLPPRSPYLRASPAASPSPSFSPVFPPTLSPSPPASPVFRPLASSSASSTSSTSLSTRPGALVAAAVARLRTHTLSSACRAAALARAHRRARRRLSRAARSAVHAHTAALHDRFCNEQACKGRGVRVSPLPTTATQHTNAPLPASSSGCLQSQLRCLWRHRWRGECDRALRWCDNARTTSTASSTRPPCSPLSPSSSSASSPSSTTATALTAAQADHPSLHAPVPAPSVAQLCRLAARLFPGPINAAVAATNTNAGGAGTVAPQHASAPSAGTPAAAGADSALAAVNAAGAGTGVRVASDVSSDVVPSVSVWMGGLEVPPQPPQTHHCVACAAAPDSDDEHDDDAEDHEHTLAHSAHGRRARPPAYAPALAATAAAAAAAARAVEECKEEEAPPVCQCPCHRNAATSNGSVDTRTLKSTQAAKTSATATHTPAAAALYFPHAPSHAAPPPLPLLSSRTVSSMASALVWARALTAALHPHAQMQTQTQAQASTSAQAVGPGQTPAQAPAQGPPIPELSLHTPARPHPHARVRTHARSGSRRDADVDVDMPSRAASFSASTSAAELAPSTSPALSLSPAPSPSLSLTAHRTGSGSGSSTATTTSPSHTTSVSAHTTSATATSASMSSIAGIPVTNPTPPPTPPPPAPRRARRRAHASLPPPVSLAFMHAGAPITALAVHGDTLALAADKLVQLHSLSNSQRHATLVAPCATTALLMRAVSQRVTHATEPPRKGKRGGKGRVAHAEDGDGHGDGSAGYGASVNALGAGEDAGLCVYAAGADRLVREGDGWSGTWLRRDHAKRHKHGAAVSFMAHVRGAGGPLLHSDAVTGGREGARAAACGFYETEEARRGERCGERVAGDAYGGRSANSYRRHSSGDSDGGCGYGYGYGYDSGSIGSTGSGPSTGLTMVTGGLDGTVRVWDVERMEAHTVLGPVADPDVNSPALAGPHSCRVGHTLFAYYGARQRANISAVLADLDPVLATTLRGSGARGSAWGEAEVGGCGLGGITCGAVLDSGVVACGTLARVGNKHTAGLTLLYDLRTPAVAGPALCENVVERGFVSAISARGSTLAVGGSDGAVHLCDLRMLGRGGYITTELQGGVTVHTSALPPASTGNVSSAGNVTSNHSASVRSSGPARAPALSMPHGTPFAAALPDGPGGGQDDVDNGARAALAAAVAVAAGVDVATGAVEEEDALAPRLRAGAASDPWAPVQQSLLASPASAAAAAAARLVTEARLDAYVERLHARYGYGHGHGYTPTPFSAISPQNAAHTGATSASFPSGASGLASAADDASVGVGANVGVGARRGEQDMRGLRDLSVLASPALADALCTQLCGSHGRRALTTNHTHTLHTAAIADAAEASTLMDIAVLPLPDPGASVLEPAAVTSDSLSPLHTASAWPLANNTDTPAAAAGGEALLQLLLDAHALDAAPDRPQLERLSLLAPGVAALYRDEDLARAVDAAQAHTNAYANTRAAANATSHSVATVLYSVQGSPNHSTRTSTHTSAEQAADAAEGAIRVSVGAGATAANARRIAAGSKTESWASAVCWADTHALYTHTGGLACGPNGPAGGGGALSTAMAGGAVGADATRTLDPCGEYGYGYGYGCDEDDIFSSWLGVGVCDTLREAARVCVEHMAVLRDTPTPSASPIYSVSTPMPIPFAAYSSPSLAAAREASAAREAEEERVRVVLRGLCRVHCCDAWTAAENFLRGVARSAGVRWRGFRRGFLTPTRAAMEMEGGEHEWRLRLPTVRVWGDAAAATHGTVAPNTTSTASTAASDRAVPAPSDAWFQFTDDLRLRPAERNALPAYALPSGPNTPLMGSLNGNNNSNGASSGSSSAGAQAGSAALRAVSTLALAEDGRLLCLQAEHAALMHVGPSHLAPLAAWTPQDVVRSAKRPPRLPFFHCGALVGDDVVVTVGEVAAVLRINDRSVPGRL